MISKSPRQIFSDSEEEEEIFLPPAWTQNRNSKADRFTSPSPILSQAHDSGNSRGSCPISSLEETWTPSATAPAYNFVNFDGGRMKVRCIPADGDCLFRSALHQLRLDSLPSSEDITCLRFKVSKFIRENVSLYKEFYPESVINDYIRDIQNLHVWGGYESIVAIANIFQRTVEVYHELGTVQKFQPRVENPGPALRVAYRCIIDEESCELVYNHYDSVVDVEDEPRTECQQQLEDLLAEVPRVLGPAASDDVSGDCSCRGHAVAASSDDADSDSSCPSLPSLSPKRKIATSQECRLEREVSAVRRPASMPRDAAKSIVEHRRSVWSVGKSAGRLTLKKRKKDDVPRPQIDVLYSQHPEVPVPEVSHSHVSTFIKTVYDAVVTNECTCIGPSSARRSRIEDRYRTHNVSTNVSVVGGQLVGTSKLHED